MKTRTIKSFVELHNALRNTWSGHPIFRGEDRDDYLLMPKYGRFMAINKKNDSVNEILMLEDFKRRAVPFIPTVPQSNLEWIAIAQHYGLATRLLDWTNNPLIAAYFAVHDNYDVDSVIYVMQDFELKHIDGLIDPYSIKEDYIFKPKHSTSRITAQSGLFTLHADPGKQFIHTTLERWVIKKSCAIELDITLAQFGVDAASVFPGLDGLSSDIHDNFIRL